VLTKAREKKQTKQSVVEKGGAEVPQPGAAAATLRPASQTDTAGVKVDPPVAGQPGRLLAAAAITNFKPGGSRAKRSTQGARTHLVAPPGPVGLDTNPWAPLLKSRRGLNFSVRVLERLLALFRARGSVPVEGCGEEPLTARALVLLFQGEYENSYLAAGRQRAGGSSSVFQLVGNQTTRNIVTIQGRAYDPGPDHDPSVARIPRPHLLPLVQANQYVVPVLNPASALGLSAAEDIHDQRHGESPASSNARASRSYHFMPSGMPTFKALRASCFTCRRVVKKRGKNVISPLTHLGETSMVEGAVLMLDVAGPYLLKARPNIRGRVDKIKLHLLLSICLFSHRISVAVLDSMTTSSLTGAINQIVLENGWKPVLLSFDAGSSLVPAAAAAAQGIHNPADDDDDGGEEDAQQPYELGRAAAAEVVRNLGQSGYRLRPVRAKASYRQSSIESSIGSFKRTLMSSFLPGLPGMTVCSFQRAVSMSVSMMNLRPVVLLPYGAADPGELNCASPSSLRGPSHAQWTPLGASRHYAGQMAVVAGQQTAFKKAFKKHYLRCMYKNHNMATTGKDQFNVNDVVMICDLSSTQGQSPHPAVGRIKAFLDPLHAQAIIAYGAGRTVDRPLQLLVKLVGAEEQIPEEGLLFDPFIQEDIAQAEEQRKDDEHLQVDGPGLDGERPAGEEDGHLHGAVAVPEPVGELRLPAHAGQQNGPGLDGDTGVTAGVTGEQADDGSENADDGSENANDGNENANDGSEEAGDAGEKEQEEKQEEKKEGDNASVEALIASQGWQGGRCHPPRIRKKINKY